MKIFMQIPASRSVPRAEGRGGGRGGRGRGTACGTVPARGTGLECEPAKLEMEKWMIPLLHHLK
jgi:hypothetical protein